MEDSCGLFETSFARDRFFEHRRSPVRIITPVLETQQAGLVSNDRRLQFLVDELCVRDREAVAADDGSAMTLDHRSFIRPWLMAVITQEDQVAVGVFILHQDWLSSEEINWWRVKLWYIGQVSRSSSCVPVATTAP